ncbi:MAG TPA: EboA domain-containing protein [Planctomycetota bacterium]|nr:EboA domain-containing protein [Planctomycetota bacterium]
MRELLSELERVLPAAERQWLEDAGARAEREGASAVRTLLPALPRRLGRQGFATGLRRIGAATIDLGAWRRCDVAAAALLSLARADDGVLLDLHAHGDLEERTMVLRAATVREPSAATAVLFAEVQRSNAVPHFEALACDNDLAARACGRIEGFGREQLDRMVLKAAFLGLRLARLFGVERRANEELSRMLQDLATEREAAGRPVWPDTALLIARAPVPGTVARLLGDLEHGDDERRAAAAVALGLLGRADLLPFVRERLPREPKPAIRDALAQTIAALGG